MISFQLFSDLNLEEFVVPPAIEDTLILAGNIGTLNTPDHLLEKFLLECSKKWKRVLYAPGNKEFHHKKVTYRKKSLQHLSRQYENYISKHFTNVYFLNGSGVEFDDCICYGMVGWPPIDLSDTDAANLYDFQWIHASNRKTWTQAHMREQSNIDVGKLRRFFSLVGNPSKPFVMISHFPPVRRNTLFSSSVFGKKEEEEKDMRSYYTWPDKNKLLDTVLETGVSECNWVSGHTRFSYDFTEKHGKSNIRFVANQGFLGFKPDGFARQVNFLIKMNVNFFLREIDTIKVDAVFYRLAFCFNSNKHCN